ncbi:hypothetical protein BCV69DRAFT_201142 [Microstroma glucosiphilum]|uniref:Secreted protein n=1 Tax=Pseudomicrostroma glucosiphilum TaxID=1684307 RepID=A0A316U6F5_9BASI|nr:hypothetical protein BCV69DRAFT_201142 [Pseudomicrostroma glucosiphilum]PWN20847.1 hypothetical protein BCV69DRAFT_201142 [Pseudomicrostroma glucosiphilum]
MSRCLLALLLYCVSATYWPQPSHLFLSRQICLARNTIVVTVVFSYSRATSCSLSTLPACMGCRTHRRTYE